MFGRNKGEVATTKNASTPEREWRLIERVVMAHTAELKKQRRWGVLFKSLTFIYLFILLGYIISSSGGFQTGVSSGGHTAVVDVYGAVMAGELAGAESVIESLNDALKHDDTKAVVLRINSPGGSPVQSAYIYNEVTRLRDRYSDIPIYSVIVDAGASAAYHIASATAEIHADGSSVVGSIGVTAVGFGFEELMQRLGIERRQYVSGEHKAFLDPFLAVDPEEKALFEALLQDVHEQFIADVKAGRGDRLVADDKLFSGLFWTGAQALELGLVDGLKSTAQLAREIGYPRLVNFTVRLSPLERFARDMGAAIAETMLRIGLQEDMAIR